MEIDKLLTLTDNLSNAVNEEAMMFSNATFEGSENFPLV